MNPFPLPGWEKNPMRTLRPWRNPLHRDFYVPVDSTQQAFKEFVEHMGDLEELLTEGRYTLVTGDTRCGKTALVNRCADWVVQRAEAERHKGVVIDLSDRLEGRQDSSIDARMGEVCDRLLAELANHDALHTVAREQFRTDRAVPHQVLPQIGGALKPQVVLIVLLPSPNDVVEEVVRYAMGMRSRKVLFLAESARFSAEQVAWIMRRLEATTASISLRVGRLGEGDAELFVADRISRWAASGVYPRMSPEALDLVEGWARSVGVGSLQKLLYDVYEATRQAGRGYADTDLIRPGEVVAHVLRALQG
jgi:hypothetical protein